MVGVQYIDTIARASGKLHCNCHDTSALEMLTCCMSLGTAQISQFAKQPQPQHSRPQLQPSPQQSTGSVMMDITDTATAAAARPATDDLTLAGYTRAIEQGRHPAWGSQQTSQLNEGTPVKQQAATPQAARSRLATSALKWQAWLAFH